MRSHRCGLGVPVACGVGRAKKIFQRCKPTKTGSTPPVVPGAAPALAKAGVGGFFFGIQKNWGDELSFVVQRYFLEAFLCKV